MSISTNSDLLHLLSEQEQQIRGLGVARLGLFGSFVREQPHAESDIDILVEFEPGCKTFDNFINLSFYLEELFGRKVDLLTPESLSPYIGPHILPQVEYVPFST